MWIFDSCFKSCVELWSRERGLERISAAYPPSFYMHLKDPRAPSIPFACTPKSYPISAKVETSLSFRKTSSIQAVNESIM
jgi:hypothetical protein